MKNLKTSEIRSRILHALVFAQYLFSFKTSVISVSSVANLFHRPLTVDAGVRMTDDILPKNGRESWKNYP